jgi:shikimate dehydrogenase
MVIGDPIRHSLSPALHNAAFAACGLDWVYVACPVPAGGAAGAVEAMRLLGIEGMSVTMPHKQGVAVAVDELAAEAEALGAVNCVRREGDRLIGENTDGPGLLRSIREDLGVDPAGRTCLVVGAGGAAKAAILSLAKAGAKVQVVNRTESAAQQAAALAGSAGSMVGPHAAADADIIVQATNLGMHVDDALPLDPTLLGAGQFLVDLIYHPAETPLLAAARSRGVTTTNGLGMLLHQACVQFTHWTGVDAPIEAMRAAYT